MTTDAQASRAFPLRKPEKSSSNERERAVKGTETTLLDYLEGSKNRYIIPVYQRNYSWTEENCRQLFDDIRNAAENRRKSHFLGSVVSQGEVNGTVTEHHIIDGQQRLTTVTLLLLAIRNLIQQGKVAPKNASLAEDIYEIYLFAKQAKSLKLVPVKNDRDAFRRLFGSEEDFDRSSALTRNYEFFCNAILSGVVPVDRLYDALSKLEIISITLGRDDNAQLIFESLNSTGLALTEGDKIRNYVLMSLSPGEQTKFYENYWLKIEEFTNDDVSAFVRCYIIVMRPTKKLPNIDRVYREFKAYVTDGNLDTEQLLRELLSYARLYKKLLDCRCDFEDRKLGEQTDACLRRLARLNVSIARPFLLEVLRLVRDGNVSEADALKIFLTIESYIFRRYICDASVTALKYVFAALNREILRYDGTANDYLAKFTYALRARQRNARFPDDDEFRHAFEYKDVFHGNNCGYIFERFENHGEKAPNDIFKLLDEKKLTIEHIMPQTLSNEWREELGTNADEIHQKWCHRMANLTLTAYNPELSNKPFREKRDAPKVGYKAGGIRLNASIAEHDCWGEAELRERNEEMLNRAMKIWERPATDFKPATAANERATRGQIAEILHDWIHQAKGATECPNQRAWKARISFTTAEMSAILPNCSCEINNTGESVFVRFLIFPMSATGEFRERYERINELYPARIQKQDWKVRTHFTTSKLTVGPKISKEKIFAGMDALLEEIRGFEAELAKKLGIAADI